MPDEFFISLYILVTYEKHRKRNLRKTSKKLRFLEVPIIYIRYAQSIKRKSNVLLT